VSADYAPALWIPTTHFWSGSGGQQRKWIILHGTAGGSSAQAIASYFQSNNPPTSVHYVIGQDGVVAQCVGEANSAWGNGVLSAGHDSWWSDAINPNLQTFSIEHVKPSIDNSDQLTAAQQAASFALIKHLCDTYNIPRRQADANGGITGHFSIDPVNRSRCPGPYPWAALWAYLGSGGTPVITIDHDASGNITGAHDGDRHLGVGFAQLVQANGWESATIDTPETYVAGDKSLATLSGTEIQTLVWTQADGPKAYGGNPLRNVADAVVAAIQAAEAKSSGLQGQLATASSDLAAAKAQIGQLSAQIEQLQQQIQQLQGQQQAPDPAATSALELVKQLKATLGI